MSYFVSRLGAKAYNQVEGGLNANGTFVFTDVDSIVQVLKAAFGDVDEAATAQKKLLNFKQGNQSIPSFLPEWQSLAQKSGFNDAALIALLRSALHSTLLHRITLMPTTAKTWMGFIDQVRAGDQLVRQTHEQYYKTRVDPNATFIPTTTSAIQATQAEDGDLMDLSAAGAKLVWTDTDVKANRRPKTDTEKEARKKYCKARGLCLWCSSSQHRASDCATAPWNKDRKNKNVKAHAATVEDDDQEEGKA